MVILSKPRSVLRMQMESWRQAAKCVIVIKIAIDNLVGLSTWQLVTNQVNSQQLVSHQVDGRD